MELVLSGTSFSDPALVKADLEGTFISNKSLNQEVSIAMPTVVQSETQEPAYKIDSSIVFSD